MADSPQKKERVSGGKSAAIWIVLLLFETFQLAILLIFGGAGALFTLILLPLGSAFWFMQYLLAACITAFEILIFFFWLPWPENSKEWSERIMYLSGTGIAELVPILALLPNTLAGIILLVHLIRKSDREYNEKHAKDVNPLPPERPRATRIRDASRELRAAPRASSVAASRLANRPTVNQARA